MICLPPTPTEIKNEYQIDIFGTATNNVIDDTEIRNSIIAACWRRFRHRPIGDFDHEYWQDILNDRVADLWVTYRYKCQYYKDRIIMDLTTSRTEESRTHETENISDVVRDTSSSDTTTYDITIDENTSHNITVDENTSHDITVDENTTHNITVNENTSHDITVDENTTHNITVNENTSRDVTVDDTSTSETENLPDTPVVAGSEYLSTRGKNTGQKQETGTSTGQKNESGTTTGHKEETGTTTGQKQETGTTTGHKEETGTTTGQKNETGTTTRKNKQTGTTGNVGSTDETISTTGNVSGSSTGTVTRQDGLTVELLNRIYDNLRNPFADFAKELDPIFMNRW